MQAHGVSAALEGRRPLCRGQGARQVPADQSERLADRADGAQIGTGPDDHLGSGGGQPLDRCAQMAAGGPPRYQVGHVVGADDDDRDVRPHAHARG